MKNIYIKKQPAFTMIELVFVIVVMGILAAMALPRLERDIRQEAADNILSAIRYTQQLALIDNKTSTDANWQKRLWAIRFTGGINSFYTVATDDSNNGSITKIEAAIDPANGKYLYNSSGAFSNMASDESPNLFLAHQYGIDTISFAGGCSSTAKHVAFDHLGRPFNGIGSATNDYGKIMHSDCNLTFGFSDTSINSLVITVEKQTGYASIVGQPNS